MAYTISILDDKEFDALDSIHTNGSDISMSLGFANPKTGKAFVRYTSVPDMQKFLINHELDELYDDESSHEDENGIRHLKFFKELFMPYIAPVLASAIPGIGAFAGPATAAAGGMLKKSTEPGKQSFGELAGAGALSGATNWGLGKLTGGFGSPGNLASKGSGMGGVLSAFGKNLMGMGQKGFGIPTAIGNIGKGVSSLLGGLGSMWGGGAGAAGAVNPANMQLSPMASAMTPQQMISPNFANPAVAAQTYGGASPGTQGLNLGGFLNKLNPMNWFSGTGSGGGGGMPPTGNIGTGQKTGGNLLDKFMNPGVLGAGLLGLGLGKGMPKVPQLPESVQNLRQQLQGGETNPWMEAGANYMQKTLGEQFLPLDEAEIQARMVQLNDQYEDDLDQLQDMYKNIRPAADYENDSSYKKDLNDLNERYAQMRQEVIGSETRALKQQFDARQMGAASGLAGMGANQMQQLISLAQYDVDMIAAQLGIDLEKARLFKSTMMNLGGTIIANQLDPNRKFNEVFRAKLMKDMFEEEEED